ncbi:hypothetical protein AFNJKBDN_CDS0039 [Halorubrum virus V_ICIS4]|nr:hypothetical protein AFNJKBDN_CDS0039 [Halorubrum virus V_ICIS4]
MADKEALQERNRLLRNCIPGETLELACSDNRTRTVEITHRIELENGTAVLKADGHGTRYQVNAPAAEKDCSPAQLRWPSGFAFVVGVSVEAESDQLWSDTTAADLGVSER